MSAGADAEGGVLAVVDHRRGELRDVSFEMVTAGRSLVDAVGGELHLAVVAGDVERFAEMLDVEGVDAVHTVADGEEFNHDVYATTVEALYADLEPEVLVMPGSVNGLDYAPAVANRLDLPLASGAVALSTDGGDVEVTRRIYRSKLEVTVAVEETPFALTVRDGAFPVTDNTGEAEIRPFEVAVDESALGSRVLGFEEVGEAIDVTYADLLIAVGRGIGSEENLELVERLAEVTGGTLVASRPVVDSGWVERSRQVGQSGQYVRPTVYLAVGISGAAQHVGQMENSETVVAIDRDPSAPIFDVADYGVVGDLFEVVPALVEQFEGDETDA
ncbi:electron transfer flavoprotein subunit alpha/FixB family protein [Candidatus Halobonum tyrrellensis]|uniref:Electron transfer flavoprotein subunit alpha n=1 Tax=Candidatus Halobonum tyrrellensis G22 TaxID=1324957 RepID=V4HN01_9EURY|nr:electron transfer flavoprotein subunit alpha/FixB family protein [Candidatus Halobonum tyrrellensis]ESP89289.1 electron transfer flavoprotein subunit alpha [Candidatus Halobonum tyrrellensis G22]